MGINALNAFPVRTEQTMGGSRSTQALGVAAGGHCALRDWNGHQRAAEALSSAGSPLPWDLALTKYRWKSVPGRMAVWAQVYV